MDYLSETSKNTYEICAPGVTSEIANLQNVPLADMEFWLHTFQKQDHLYIDEVNTLGAARLAERETLQAQNIHSLVAVPLRRSGRIIGFIGVDDPSQSVDNIDRLEALGDYMAIMLERRDLMETLRREKVELEKMERMQGDLLDNLPCGAGIYEIRGNDIKAIYLNRGYQSIVGTKISEYTGFPVFDAIKPEEIPVILQGVKRAITERREFSIYIHIRGADGLYAPFLLSGRCVAGTEGVYLGYATYTPLLQNAGSIAEMIPLAFSALMQNSSKLAFIKDRQLRYLCGTKKMAELVGLSDEKELAGKTDLELFEPELAERYGADDRNVLTKGEILMDAVEQIPSVDGRIHYFSTSKYPLYDSSGNIVGLYGVGHDITQQMENERLYKILQTASSAYFEYVCVISLENGRYELFAENGHTCHAIPTSGDYLDTLVYLRDQFVISTARNRYYNHMNLEAISKEMEHNHISQRTLF